MPPGQKNNGHVAERDRLIRDVPNDGALRVCHVIRCNDPNVVLINLDRDDLGNQAKTVDFRVHRKATSRCGMVERYPAPD